MIRLFNAFIDKRAGKYIQRCLDSGYINEGERVVEFERQLMEYWGMLNVVAVNSGTSALHLALRLAGVGVGDEVILPAQTFIATGLAVLYCGAKPVFVDIDYDNGNILPSSIASAITPKTKAVMIVDWGGTPCHPDVYKAAGNIPVIEDAAHQSGRLISRKWWVRLPIILVFLFRRLNI